MTNRHLLGEDLELPRHLGALVVVAMMPGDQELPVGGVGGDDRLEVSDCGYPLRSGWATRDVRQSLRDVYGLALPLERLAIEEGVLRHRSRTLLPGLDVTRLRLLLTRQGAVAAALERSLR